MSNIRSETIALGALFQACNQIQKIARTGYADPHACAAIIRALIITNANTIDDIYQSSKLVVGFKQLLSSFTPINTDKNPGTIEVTKTAFKLIALEQSIEKNAQVFNTLGQNIDRLRENTLRDYPDYEQGNPDIVLNEHSIADYAKLYQSLISPNFPKLIIYGEEQYLRRSENQEQIRALLLAAIRAIVLWRQVGGKRRFFIFRRKGIIAQARSFLNLN